MNGFYTKTFSNSTAYQYIGFTINKVIGGVNSDMVNFSELQLFGKEFINLTPVYTPIESLALYDLTSDRQTAITSLSNTLNTKIDTKQDVLLFTAPLTKTGNTTSIDLSSYLTILYASNTYYTIANATTVSNSLQTSINTKENILSFTAPLTKSGSVVSIDLSNYITILSVSNTYYTIANAIILSNSLQTNINTKENILSFTAPLTKSGNVVSIDLSGYLTSANLSTYATTTNLNLKQNILTASTTILGIGSNITAINYSNISNPSSLNLLPLSGGTIEGNIIFNADNSAFFFGSSGAQASGNGAFSMLL